MNKKKWIKIIIISLVLGVVTASSIALYLYNMPHRDVVNSASDYSVTAKQLVEEYLLDSKKADAKYLDEEGDSKIFEITGVIKEISEDFDKQKVILLEGVKEKAGVSCTFTKETNQQVNNLKVGQKVKIKGVIRSGATFDSDLEMYENVIIEKSSITNK